MLLFNINVIMHPNVVSKPLPENEKQNQNLAK